MKQINRQKLGKAVSFSGFVLPAVAAITLFVGIPFAMCIYYSFYKWNGISKTITFLGLDNYIRIFSQDVAFRQAIQYTLVYALFVVILVNVVALFLAALLENSNVWGKGLMRTAFYIPNIISLVIIGFVWKFLFGRVFEDLFIRTGNGIFAMSWLGDTKLAVFSTIFVSVWQSLGFYMLIYIAGLQSVPEDLLEAARIDGAGSLRRFFCIVLPLIMPSITSCVFFSISSSLKSFELVFSLTGGGPGTSTTPVALDVYNTAFNNNLFGYGSAKSVILFTMVAVVTVLQVTVFKKKELEL